MVAVLIMSLCVKRFQNDEAAANAQDISRILEVPIRLVRSVLSELTEARLLATVCSSDSGDVSYQPACDIDRLTVAAVIDRLDRQGATTVPVVESTGTDKLKETIERFREINEQSPANLKLQLL
jgi:membrane protein